MIYVNYGTAYADMAYQLMAAADVVQTLKKDMRVCIKPNLVLADSPENGATTHPEVVEGILRFLKDFGIRDITIAEGAWVGERNTADAFAFCGYERLQKKYDVALFDTKKDAATALQFQGDSYRICSSILNCDYLINVPVLKGHCQTKLTCCMKNLKGCIPDSEKRRYHTLGLSKPIAALNALLKPDLHLVDGICGDLTFEEGGNPVTANRLLLGYNAVETDTYCAGLIGYAPEDIGYLRYAYEYLGKPGENQITELNRDKRPKEKHRASPAAQRLAKYIDERSACSACYAALIFALDKQRFGKPEEKIKIGQDFRGTTCPGFGVGNCTAGCETYVKGCPPTAHDILESLLALK